jgi:hypothetical protein
VKEIFKMPKQIKTVIQAKGLNIAVYITANQADYISLTDIARYKSDAPDDVVKNWLRNRESIEFLGLWEQLNNPDFKPVEFDGFRTAAGRNAFVLSPQKWIAATNAIGLKSKSGRYGWVISTKWLWGRCARSSTARRYSALMNQFPLLPHFLNQRNYKDLSSNPCRQTGVGGLCPPLSSRRDYTKNKNQRRNDLKY